MIHFGYLAAFAFFVAVCFGIFASGTNREKTFYAVKVFAQFIIISFVLAWIFYFLPW